MKLRAYTRHDLAETTSPKTNLGIYVDSSKGRIVFNKDTSEYLGIAAGNYIMLLQDEDHEMDWYIQPFNNDGFKLKPHKKKNLIIESVALVDRIKKSCNSSFTRLWLPVSPHTTLHSGIELYAVITKGGKHAS